MLTDGEPTIGVTDSAEILKSVKEKNSAKSRIFVFGVGEDLNAKLLDALVSENHGVSEYIGRDENLELPLAAFYDKIDWPVLTDLSIEFRGGGVSLVYPKPLPDLFRGEQLDLYGRYEADGFKTVVVQAKYQGETRVFEYSLDFKGGTNVEIPRLWAHRAIGHLLEEIRLHGEKAELKNEIVRLSKLYGVLTPYTSYLIVEEDQAIASTRGARGRNRFRFAAGDALAQPEAASADGVVAEERARVLRSYAARRLADADELEAESGAEAVDLSRSIARLKSGFGGAALHAGITKSVSGRASGGVDRFVPAVDKRAVSDRTFYRQGSRWIDSLLTTRDDIADAEVDTVKYLSDEYFALLTKHPTIGKLLSVAPEVTFVWDGRVVSVVN